MLNFLVAVFFAFFVPGNVLLNKVELPRFFKFCLCIVLGLVLWGYQGFIFGYLNLRIGVYPYLIVFFAIWIYQNRNNFRNIAKIVTPPKIHFDPILVITLLVGVVFMLSAIWFVGVPINEGLFFCCRGVPDDMYHLALTDELIKNMPPFEPGASKIVLENYHYWANLIMAETIRVFGTDLMDTVYRFFPLLLSLLLAGAVVSFPKLLGLKKSFARWFALFVFFGGDILFILTWIFGRGVNFNVYGLDDATKLLAGPTRSFSIVVIFWAICLLIVWLKKRNIFLDIVLGLMFASLVGMKVYTGIFAVGGLFFLGSYYLFLRRDFKRLLMPIISGLLSILIFFPVNGGSNGIGLYYPWAFREFIAKADLGTVFLILRQRIYVADGKFLQVISYDLLFVAIYITFMFGAINIAFLQTKKSLSRIPKELHLFLISGIFVSLILGFFGSQTNGGGNTIQMIIALYFFAAIYAALAISTHLEGTSKKLGIIVSVLVIALTVPRAFNEGLQNFARIVSGSGYVVSNDEINSLNWIKSHPCNDCVVSIWPEWSDQELFMRVSFLSGKQVFIAGYNGVLADHNVKGIKKRRKINQEIYSSYIKYKVKSHLLKNNISYLFMPKDAVLPAGAVGGLVREAYSTKTVKVMYVQREL